MQTPSEPYIGTLVINQVILYVRAYFCSMVYLITLNDDMDIHMDVRKVSFP